MKFFLRDCGNLVDVLLFVLQKALYQSSDSANLATAATLQAKEHKVKLSRESGYVEEARCWKKNFGPYCPLYCGDVCRVFALATFIEECL